MGGHGLIEQTLEPMRAKVAQGNASRPDEGLEMIAEGNAMIGEGGERIVEVIRHLSAFADVGSQGERHGAWDM